MSPSFFFCGFFFFYFPQCENAAEIDYDNISSDWNLPLRFVRMSIFDTITLPNAEWKMFPRTQHLFVQTIQLIIRSEHYAHGMLCTVVSVDDKYTQKLCIIKFKSINNHLPGSFVADQYSWDWFNGCRCVFVCHTTNVWQFGNCFFCMFCAIEMKRKLVTDIEWNRCGIVERHETKYSSAPFGEILARDS